MIRALRLASSAALVASLLALVSASCGLDTSGTDSAAGDDGAAPLDARGLADTSAPRDGQASIDGAHPGDAAIDGSQMPDASVDSSPPADSAPADTSVGCDAASGCYVIPGGWALVAVTGSQTPACPPGFAMNAPIDVFEGPTVGANACGCGACTIGTEPSCAGVPVSVYYDGFGCIFSNCGCAGVPAQNANTNAGSCNTDLYTLSTAGLDLKFVAGAATGGTCTAPATSNPQNVTYAGEGRVCVQDAPSSGNCVGNQCTPSLASPYRACISAAGHQTCPAPYTQSQDVGTGVDYTCGACGCTATAACDGTITYYTNSSCTMGGKTFDANGSCQASGGGTYEGYIFTGEVVAGSTACSATAGAPSGVTLQNERTVCCTP